MKKTFCDRCGKECDGVAIQRFVIFDVNKAIDVCDDCYQAFFQWLSNKPESVKCEDPEGVEEFIKDVVNGEDEFDDFFDCCDHCHYDDHQPFEYPCRECKNCDRSSMVDHYIRKEENDEN